MRAVSVWKAVTAATLIGVLTLAGCSRDPAAKEARYLRRGKELMQKRDYAHAVVEFSSAVAAMPKDAEAHYQLGLAQLEANKAPQAARSFQTATRLNPKHIEAAIKLAEMMVQSRQDNVLQDVEQHMSALLADAPDNPDAARALAIAEFKLGKAEDAEQRLSQILERFPSNLKSAAALASMKLANRDFNGAEAALRSVARELPQSVEAGLALAQFYVLAGKRPEAEAETTRVLRLDPSSAPGLLLQAAFAIERGNIAEADQLYKKISALPGGAYAHAHATFLLQQKKFDDAIAEFRALAQASRADRKARTRLVNAQLAAGRQEDARKELDAVLKKNAKDQDALLQRSQILLNAADFEAAERDLRAIAQLSPTSAEAHFGLARVAAAAGNDLRSRDELGEALRLRPDLLAVRIELARALLAARAPQTALETLDSAPDAQKTTPEFVAMRNWALLALGRRAEAQGAVADALQKRSHPQLLFQRGVLSLSDKKYAAARADADAVLATNPLDIRALQLAVEARVALKERAQAEQLLRDAAARAPASAELQSFVGDAFVALGKSADARRFYDAALALRPSHAGAAVALARIDLREGRADAARQRLNDSLKLSPRSVAALMALGDLEYAAGNRPAAADLYRRAADADRRNVVALNNYAYLRAESDPDAALPLAQKALELAPDSAMILDTLGWIYYRKGMHELAVSHLQKAMSREPTPRRQFHLGMAQMKLGQKQSASENLSAALKKAPNLTSTEVGW